MTNTPQDATPNAVLHIRRAPLPRTQREGLAALGVEVEHLHPDTINRAIVNAGTEYTTEERDTILQRVAQAPICVVDEGTGLLLGTLILNLRENSKARTLTTSEPLRDVAGGIALRQELQRAPKMQCELVTKIGLLEALRALGSPMTATTAVRVAPEGTFVRPARPLPYGGETYSCEELDDGSYDYRTAQEVQSYRLPPRTLLAPGTAASHRVRPVLALTFLMKHLPTDELDLLAGEEARAWWNRLVQEIAQHGRYFFGSDVLFWNALARDGGRGTLAALPEELWWIRDDVAGKWDATASKLQKDLGMELTSAVACTRDMSEGAQAMRSWGVIPCDDPLAPDADPNLFRPTLTTLRIARRYRSAPEVLLASYARWGARPYRELATAKQLEAFVAESPPTSAEEVEGWIRLLATLPNNSMKQGVGLGIAEAWPRVDLDVVNLIDERPITQAGHEFETHLMRRVACFTGAGHLQDDVVARITSPERQRRVRASAEWIDRLREDNRRLKSMTEAREATREGQQYPNGVRQARRV